MRSHDRWQRMFNKLKKMQLLLSCWIIAVITAKDLPREYYGMVNGSICLQIRTSPPYRNDQWLFNEEAIVLPPNVTPKYTDKVDYNPKNRSLCINRLTETDSGIYIYSFINSEYKSSTESHKIIVQGTVPRPVIRMSKLHSNLSAEICNITVNCSIQDNWVWSVCGEDGCRTLQRSLWKVNITIFTDGRSIFCSGNNDVSTSNVSLSTESTCFGKSNPEYEGTPELSVSVKTIVVVAKTIVVVAVFVSVYAVIVFLIRRRAKPSTAPINENQPAEPQSVLRGSTSCPSHAEACFENVDVAEPGSKQKVETVYSVLQLPHVTSSRGKSDFSKDTQEHKKTKEASSSQCVTLDEAEHPAHIDTLYSVLQKPKI